MDFSAVDSDFDTIETIDDIKNWNKPRRVVVTDRVFDHTDLETGDVKWVVYEFREGAGKRPKYIIADPLTKINKGEQELYLQPADDEHEFFKYPIDPFDDEPAITKIAKNLGVTTKGIEINVVWQQIHNTHKKHKVFYVLTDAIPKEELKKTRNIRNILDESFNIVHGKLDPRLDIYFKIQYVHYDKSLTPQEYQRYNPHSIVITNTKVGKTTSSKIVGINVNRSTPAGLIGYSTPQKTQKGVIHNEAKPIFIDEFEVLEKEKEVVSCLLGLLEDGEEYIARGDGFYVKTWSAIDFLGNPIGEDNRFKTDAIYIFEQLITTLTSNTEALGSRMGLILFGDDFQELKPTETDEVKKERSLIFLKTAQKHISRMFSVLLSLKDIIDWLNKPIDTYKDQIETLIFRIEYGNDIYCSSKLIQFLKGLIHSYKHIRGSALRLALYDMIDELWQLYWSVDGDIGQFRKLITPELIKKLIETAKEKVDIITDINEKSLRRILDLIRDDDSRLHVLEVWYENLPKVHREFIKGVCKAYVTRRTNILVEGDVKKHIEGDKCSYSPSTIFKEGYKKFKNNADWLTVKEFNGIRYVKIIDSRTVQLLCNIIGIEETSEESETSEVGDHVDRKCYTSTGDTSDISSFSSSSASDSEFHEDIFDMTRYNKSVDDSEDEFDDKEILKFMDG